MSCSEDKLSSIIVLVRVAECSSFTEAAFRLGMSASGVSRAIARLEKRLGVHLVKRTTRGLSLTDEGVVYVERCRLVLAELEDADAHIMNQRSSPSGVTHVQMPPAFARKVVLPALPQFLERNPDLQVEVELSGRTPDLAEESIDVALRFGHPRDSRIVARKLCHIASVVCASPRYLERHGAPATLDDLTRHRCLTFVNPRTGRHDQWSFVDGGHTRSVPVRQVLSSNDMQTLVDAAVAGSGIVNVADINITDEIASGRLVPVLTDYVPTHYPLYLLYLPNRHLTRRVRCFIDFIVDLLQTDPARPCVDATARAAAGFTPARRVGPLHSVS
ncbi:LysR family transcriptional regulator [Paraburkholderia caballeronis]|uniref:LysR family transcriptional regulator n=1 Tax=Paraburkholderia caballeronis TaxID=416943 RepID=UPI00106643C3|nr:LysR family transcriptional regulator [Paraburkholderia caballeronis]TDV06132.1 DNA-binding transcriptional LysR family regulator [Paraburkholderia caballeronis]TDV09672.1 DNA-binding transcriptional LysR family regulator [Paraburkholderia caballeronis]TDV21737.1 DNA-binding transcriptional LysR family regulator [Paraburkholderia caballeronis]